MCVFVCWMLLQLRVAVAALIERKVHGLAVGREADLFIDALCDALCDSV